MFSRTIAYCIFFALTVTSSSADTIYTYVGDVFTYATGVYSPGDRVIGTFVLSGSFVPATGSAGTQNVTSGVVSYFFTDGHQLFTQDNSTGTFEVGFQADGTPVVPVSSQSVNADWDVNITGATGNILTASLFGDDCIEAGMGDSVAEIISQDVNKYPGGPGTWTVHTLSTPVPEGSFPLLAAAGAGFLFAGSRRKIVYSIRRQSIKCG